MGMRVILTCLLILASSPGIAQNFEVYVSDAGNRQTPPFQILKFDGDGQNPTVFISSPLNRPQDILFLEDSNTVLISNLGSGRISRHDATTGAFISEFATGISGPTRIKIGPDGLLYVLQWNGPGRVRRYTLEGDSLGNFTDSGTPQSIGLDWDREGNLYVASYTQDFIIKYDTNGVSQGPFISANLAGPTNIWFDENGDLLVLDYDGTAVKRFDSSGNYLGDFIQGVSRGEGVAYLPDGNILVGDGAARSIKEFDSMGKYVRDFAPSRTLNLLAPNAVVVRELAPPAPDQLIAHVSDLVTELEWRDNSEDEDGFRIYRRVDRGSRILIVTTGPNVTTYADDTIETGHYYEYVVAAFIGDGESDISNAATISTDCYHPGPTSQRSRPLRRSPLPCDSSISNPAGASNGALGVVRPVRK